MMYAINHPKRFRLNTAISNNYHVYVCMCCHVDTPLQEKLDTLAGQIGNGGMAAAGATFIAMMAIWFAFPGHRVEVGCLNIGINSFR